MHRDAPRQLSTLEATAATPASHNFPKSSKAAVMRHIITALFLPRMTCHPDDPDLNLQLPIHNLF